MALDPGQYWRQKKQHSDLKNQLNPGQYDNFLIESTKLLDWNSPSRHRQQLTEIMAQEKYVRSSKKKSRGKNRLNFNFKHCNNTSDF